MTEEKKSSNLTYEEKRLAFEKLGKYLSQSYRDERMDRVREKWLAGHCMTARDNYEEDYYDEDV